MSPKRSTNNVPTWEQIMEEMDAGHPANARELCEVYLKSHPRKHGGWVALAEVLRDLALYDEAKRALVRAQRLAPPSRMGFICLQWGAYYKEKGEFLAAVRWFRKAADLKEPYALVFLGAAYARLGRYEEAKTAHRKATRSSRECKDEAFLNLGLIQRAEKDYFAAIRSFDAAIKLDPDYEAARQARADVVRALKSRG